MLRVAEAVRSEQTKLSPREEIEEQTKKDREKRGLPTSVSPAPVSPLGKERASLAPEAKAQGPGEEGDKTPVSPGSKSVEGAGVTEDDEAGQGSQKLASAAEAVGPGSGITSPRVEETKAKSVHQLPEEKASEDGHGDKTHAGGKDGADPGDSVALSRGSSQDEQGNKFSSGLTTECGWG